MQLENFELFKNVNITKIKQSLKPRVYQKNEILFGENDICNGIFLLLSGQVVISTFTFSEKEETINIINPGDLFADVLLFSKKPHYLGTAYFKKSGKVIYITKEQLFDLFEKYPNMSINFIKGLAQKALEYKQINKLLTHKKISDRLLYYLKIQEKQQQNKLIYIPSITSLSLTLSLPRPSLSRELNKLINNNVISKKGKYYSIN